MITLEDMLNAAAMCEGRIVATGDLTEMQITEARTDKRMYVDKDGIGFVFLPWKIETKRDLERQRQ